MIEARGITVAGELNLETNTLYQTKKDCRRPGSWVLGKSGMDMMGARIGQITMTDPRSWPLYLSLTNARIDGFQPEGGLALSVEALDLDRNRNFWKRLLPSSYKSKATQWFETWLDSTQRQSYDPSPYQEVINFLEKTGDSTGADSIYIAGKDRQRDRACEESNILNFSTCFYLWAAFLVGYGRRLFIAILASMAFIIVGAFAFRNTETAHRTKIPLRWAYSFDMFIPLVRLRDKHYTEVDFSGNIRYYLYLHKLAGWILGTFIVASIVSLIK
jgi:hypothetical protein